MFSIQSDLNIFKRNRTEKKICGNFDYNIFFAGFVLYIYVNINCANMKYSNYQTKLESVNQ